MHCCQACAATPRLAAAVTEFAEVHSHSQNELCRASAANHAAAERLKKAFDDSDETRLLDAAGGPSDAVTVEMLPVTDPLMVAEQKINSELRAARADMAALSRLQNAAQEVCSFLCRFTGPPLASRCCDLTRRWCSTSSRHNHNRERHVLPSACRLADIHSKFTSLPHHA